MAEPALFRKFPSLAAAIPWISLAHVPTPVQPLGGEAWIKRDDLSGQPYGGNKVRKLEFLLAAARARNARRLITVGAAGSHHALATTIYGRTLGFDVTLVLFPQPLTPHVKQILLLDHALGAELRYAPRMELIPAALFATTLRYRQQRAFVIPAGGSDATGTLGYVSAALELAEQIERNELPRPATVIVAAGTLGTAAGLALGFAIAGLPISVKAVRITSRLVTNERVLARLVRGTEALLRRAGARVDAATTALNRTELLHQHVGRGYGVATDAGTTATERFAELGITLDPTYTAKAAAAFLQQNADLPKPVLFWQTLSASEPSNGAAAAQEAALPKAFRDYIRASGGL